MKRKPACSRSCPLAMCLLGQISVHAPPQRIATLREQMSVHVKRNLYRGVAHRILDLKRVRAGGNQEGGEGVAALVERHPRQSSCAPGPIRPCRKRRGDERCICGSAEDEVAVPPSAREQVLCDVGPQLVQQWDYAVTRLALGIELVLRTDPRRDRCGLCLRQDRSRNTKAPGARFGAVPPRTPSPISDARPPEPPRASRGPFPGVWAIPGAVPATRASPGSRSGSEGPHRDAAPAGRSSEADRSRCGRSTAIGHR